jgi:hypothetical protein
LCFRHRDETDAEAALDTAIKAGRSFRAATPD